MNQYKSLSYHLSAMTSGVAITFVVGFLQSILVARLLGADEYGRLATLMAFVGILSRFNDFGLTNAFGYYYRKSPQSLPSLMNILIYNVFWCAGIALIILELADFLPFLYLDSIGNKGWFGIVLWLLFVTGTPLSILTVTLTATGDYKFFAGLNSASSILQLIVVYIFYLTIGVSLQNFVTMTVIAQLLTIGVDLWYLRRYMKPAQPIYIKPWDCYKYGLKVQWGVLMKMLSLRAELLIVASLMSGTQLGIYSLALGIRDIGLIPTSIYAPPLQNMIIDRNQSQDGSDRAFVLMSLLLLGGFSLTFTLLAILALPYLIPLLYGSDFQTAIIPALILFPSTIFSSLAGICWIVYNAKDRPQLTSLVLTAGGILTPLLIYGMTIRFGLYGASLASVIASFITFICSIAILTYIQHYTIIDLRLAVKKIPQFLSELLRASVPGWLGTIRHHNI